MRRGVVEVAQFLYVRPTHLVLSGLGTRPVPFRWASAASEVGVLSATPHEKPTGGTLEERNPNIPGPPLPLDNWGVYGPQNEEVSTKGGSSLAQMPMKSPRLISIGYQLQVWHALVSKPGSPLPASVIYPSLRAQGSHLLAGYECAQLSPTFQPSGSRDFPQRPRPLFPPHDLGAGSQPLMLRA